MLLAVLGNQQIILLGVVISVVVVAAVVTWLVSQYLKYHKK